MAQLKHSIIKEYNLLLKEFFTGFKPFILYQLFTKVLIYILILPSFQLFATTLIKSSPYKVLTNGVITKYILSPQGLGTLILIMFLFITVLLIELGGLIVISNQIYTKEIPYTFNSILVYCLSNLKKLFSTSGFLIILYFFIIVPAINLNYHTSLIKNVALPGFITDVINNTPLLNFLLGFLFALFVFLSIHWIFALHITIIKNTSARNALKESFHLVRRNYRSFFKYYLGILLLTILTVFITSFICMIPIILINQWVNLSTLIGTIVVSGLISFYLLVLLVITTFIIPINIHFITRLYYQLSGERKQHLQLRSSKANRLKNMNKRTFNRILFLAFVIATLITTVMIYNIKNTKYNVDITAHRGASKQAPENTLAALKLAIDQGADYAEIDVKLTKDGHVILLHDSTLKRTTAINKKPSEFTLEEIKNLDAGSWFSSEFKGEPIPTLEEAIKLCKGKLKLNIELKGGYKDKHLVKEVIRLIKKYDTTDDNVVTSLEYDLINSVEKTDSSIITGYIMYMAFGDLNTLNTDFYSLEISRISDLFINEAHLQGREVHVWTVNDKDVVTEAIDYGVDNIITDDVTLVKNHLEYLNSEMDLIRIIERLVDSFK